MKYPVIDIVACTLCMGCVEVCPQVFRLNEDLGHIEAIEMDVYPLGLVDEAMKYCPEDAIEWAE